MIAYVDSRTDRSSLGNPFALAQRGNAQLGFDLMSLLPAAANLVQGVLGQGKQSADSFALFQAQQEERRQREAKERTTTYLIIGGVLLAGALGITYFAMRKG